MLTVLSLVAVLAVSPAARADTLPPARTVEELRGRLDSIRVKYGVPGVGLALVTRDSVLWAGGLGFADLALQKPVAAGTHFRVGSVSKSFVALGILRLVDQGKVTLDTPVRRIAPEIAVDNRWESSRPITVAELLEHTAGFDDMRFNEMYVRVKGPDLPMAEVLAINPRSRMVRWEPGTRHSYSNPGYGLAGYLLEKLTGMPYDRYLRDSIIAPLGMTTASFQLEDADTAAIAAGYSGRDPKPVGYPHIYHRPAGNLHSSPVELARLVRMFLNRGTLDGVRIVAPETVDRMERTETTTLASIGVRSGYGLANYSSLNLKVPTHGHSGGIDGFISDYQYSSEAGVGWVVLMNGGEGDAMPALLGEVGRFMLRDYPVPPKPAVAVAPAELDQYVGFYRAAAPRASLFRIVLDLVGGVRVVRRGDTLMHRPTVGRAEALIPTGRGTFRLASEPVTSRAFFGRPGALTYASGFDYWERASLAPFVLEVAGLLLALALAVAALIHALGWIPRRLAGRIPPGPPTAVRLWPLLAVGSLATLVVLAMKYGLSRGATMNPGTVGIFLAGIAFPIVGLIALLVALRADYGMVGRGLRRFELAVSIGCLGLAVWLGYYGFLGLRTWSY